MTCDLIDNDCNGQEDDLDNGNECAVLTAEIFYGDPATTPQGIAISEGYTTVDLAVGYWWWQCAGPGTPLTAPDEYLMVNFGLVDCVGAPLEAGMALGRPVPWEDEGFPLAPLDLLDAQVDPNGLGGWVDEAAGNPGWYVLILAQ